MKKILFLPLFQMQSGHHQVADALMDMLNKRGHDIEIKKIDLLSFTSHSFEKMISRTYLKWIRYAPKTYDLVYKRFFYHSSNDHSYKFYQLIFLKKMEQLIAVEKPDAIICTQGLPSHLLSQLKLNGKCTVPVINVYTDFFINGVWGIEGIDFHFLPNEKVKEFLINKYQIPSEKMIVSGIPVHEEITKCAHYPVKKDKPKILIAGGNSGLGGILKLAAEMKKSSHFDYYVLCGNNQKLYDEMFSWDLEHIKPLPYLSSRSDMNKLYNHVDAIITKPGGVTISEVLRKKLPIFIHSFLPGQEEINLTYLKQQKLVFELDSHSSLEKQVDAILNDTRKMSEWEMAHHLYEKELEVKTPDELVAIITSISEQITYNIPFNVAEPSTNYEVVRA